MESPEVFSPPLITSTKGILPTGLKKWIPTHRSGLASTEASSVMESELVFVAITQSGLTVFSSSKNIFFFNGMSSTAASMTRSQSLKPDTSVPPLTKAILASAFSRVILPLATRRSNVAFTSASPLATTSRLMSRMYTPSPFFAHRTAICDPITPAPTTPILFGEIPVAPPHLPANFFAPSIILKREISALLWDEFPSFPKCLASS
mmetsp:Transcript_28161/g.39324  ORF Transcript_28161/g.39324 Transcript_28161/m.39324 type:complete len:206 (-) Transcript_28161:108-725(-)